MIKDVAEGPFRGGVIALDVFTKIFCKQKVLAGDSEYEVVGKRCAECPFYIEGFNDRCLVREFKDKYWPEYDSFGPFGRNLRW